MQKQLQDEDKTYNTSDVLLVSRPYSQEKVTTFNFFSLCPTYFNTSPYSQCQRTSNATTEDEYIPHI